MTDYLGRLFSYTGMRIEPGSSVEAMETDGAPAPIHSEETRSIRLQTDTSAGMSPGKNNGKSHPLSESNVQRASLQNSDLISPSGSNEQPSRSSPDEPSLGKTESKSTIPAKGRLKRGETIHSESNVQRASLQNSDSISPSGSNEQPPRSSPDESSLGKAESQSATPDKRLFERGEKVSDARPDAEGDVRELSPESRIADASPDRPVSTELFAKQRRPDGGTQERISPASDKSGQIFFKDVRNWVAEGSSNDLELGRKNNDEGVESAGLISGDEAPNESMSGLSEVPGQSFAKFRPPERSETSMADRSINDLHVSIGTISLTVEGSEAAARPPAPLPSGKEKNQPTVKARSRLARHYIRIR